MILTELFLSLGKKARGLNGKPVYFTKPIEKIIIHWIGPYPHHDLTGVRGWWENGNDGGGVQASAHFIIKNENVLQCLPLNEVGWHSGDLRNYNSIGIEVIPMNTAGEFSEATQNTLKELVSFIREKLNKNLELERHFDGGNGKDCPRFYTPVTSLLDGGGRVANPPGGDERWENLKQFLNEIEPAEIPEPAAEPDKTETAENETPKTDTAEPAEKPEPVKKKPLNKTVIILFSLLGLAVLMVIFSILI